MTMTPDSWSSPHSGIIVFGITALVGGGTILMMIYHHRKKKLQQQQQQQRQSSHRDYYLSKMIQKQASVEVVLEVIQEVLPTIQVILSQPSFSDEKNGDLPLQ
jgi:uncharacterized membrane-anchored protein